MCRDSKVSRLLYQPSKRRQKKKKIPFKEIKKLVYERDGWKCCFCGSADDLTVHHLKDGDAIENMITVCKSCHSRIHSGKD